MLYAVSAACFILFNVNGLLVSSTCYDEAVRSGESNERGGYVKIVLPTRDNYILKILSSAVTNINEQESSDGSVWTLQHTNDDAEDNVVAYRQDVGGYRGKVNYCVRIYVTSSNDEETPVTRVCDVSAYRGKASSTPKLSDDVFCDDVTADEPTDEPTEDEQ